MKKLIGMVLIISLSLFILSISIEINSYDRDYYSKSFDKNGVEVITEKNKDELMIIVDDIISYLKHEGEEELLTPHFNEREVKHMIDVQELFDLLRIIKYITLGTTTISLIYFVVYRKYESLGKILLFGPFLSYIIMGTIGILGSINFQKYFTYFHLIFFDNDLWLLNPKTDLMIQMLPEPFFIGIAINILLVFILGLVVVQLLGLFLYNKYKTK